MNAQEVARKMVTVERDSSGGYGRWRLSIARRAWQPKAAPWLQTWFYSRAEADMDARQFRRAIEEGIRDALALGVNVSGSAARRRQRSRSLQAMK